MDEFDRMVGVMHRLRKECPWDREQNLSSLRKYLIEEAYECLDAIEHYLSNPDEENLVHLKEELGDVLLQVLFQSEILSEIHGPSQIESVLIQLRDKLIRRHPHIFQSPGAAQTAEEVHKQWDRIKAEEKKQNQNNDRDSLLGKIPKASPAMIVANEIGKRAHKVDFDWNNADEVWQQVHSELKEVEQAVSLDHREEELGDLLFSLVQWARHQGIDPEVALVRANNKFIGRFHAMENQASNFKKLTREEKEALWQSVKKKI